MTKEAGSLSVVDKILLAALKCSDAEIRKTFTAEQLLVAAWESDRWAFGLRGFENQHPDANKVYTKIDGTSGLVRRGMLEAEGDRILRITVAGLAQAQSIKMSIGEDMSVVQVKVDRQLQEALVRLINSREFRDWLENPSREWRFREAGSFWGIAPGTPAKTVRKRVGEVERVLEAARQRMDQMSTDSIVEQRGRNLVDRSDIDRLLELHNSLKRRFSRDLRMMDPEGDYGN